jgi:hypothetical protein
MKTNILAIVILCCITMNSFAQFTITYQQSYHPNDNVYTILCDTTNFFEGEDGSNVLWDYSNLNIIFYGGARRYKPAPFPNQCTTPMNANLYTSDTDGSDYYYSYYESDSTQLSMLGWCNQFGWVSDILNYSDPPTTFFFPFDYLNSFSDTSIGIRYAHGTTKVYNGSSLTTYDAWGELKLPWGIFHNVARVKWDYIIKDSAYEDGTLELISAIAYGWYDSITHHPLLMYQVGSNLYTQPNGTQTTSYFKYLEAYTSTFVGIAETPTSEYLSDIFPNPSKGEFSIEISDELRTDKMLILSIYDCVGKLIMQKVPEVNNGKIEESLLNVRPGIYNCRLSNGKLSFNRRIVIE